MHTHPAPQSPDFAKTIKNVIDTLKSSDGIVGRDFQQLLLYRTIQREGSHHNPRQIARNVLQQALTQLAISDPAQAKLLEMRILEDRDIRHIANALHKAESTIYRDQGRAIDSLITILHSQEAAAHSTFAQRLQARLPFAAYHPLVGVDEVLDRLMEMIAKPGPPWIISIEGIGGIGKSALADALLRRAAEAGLFDDIAWVSLQPAILNRAGEIAPTTAVSIHTAPELIRSLITLLMPEKAHTTDLTGARGQMLLRDYLQTTPHLIVVDNLETIPDLQNLVPTIQGLVNPTKFVLTTRESLYGERNVASLVVPELQQHHALQLAHTELRLSNLPQLATITEADLRPIYDTVGGNPLALRLVVGLLHIYPLPIILQDLKAARGHAATNLYTFIYRRAWDNLDEPCRQLLLAMPLLRPEGDTIDFVALACKLDTATLHSALQKLVARNLIDSRGGLHSRHYSIHGLTRTFLLEQVVKWF